MQRDQGEDRIEHDLGGDRATAPAALSLGDARRLHDGGVADGDGGDGHELDPFTRTGAASGGWVFT